MDVSPPCFLFHRLERPVGMNDNANIAVDRTVKLAHKRFQRRMASDFESCSEGVHLEEVEEVVGVGLIDWLLSYIYRISVLRIPGI